MFGFVACKSKRSSDTDKAVKTAKELFFATYECNLNKIKELTTEKFYNTHYPYGDQEMEEMLKSVPEERRKESIDQIKNNTTSEALMNKDGNMVTVVFHNEITGREFTMQLIDTDGNGKWKVNEYDY